MSHRIPRDEWASMLKEFTNRNAGRRVTLEVDGEAFGAQSEGRDYPLRGVAFDPRDGRVEIMLGDQASVDRDVTRAIADPLDIDLLRGPDGRDQALRVSEDGVQTVLRFERGG